MSANPAISIFVLTAGAWVLLLVAQYLKWAQVLRPLFKYLHLVVTGALVGMLILCVIPLAPLLEIFTGREFSVLNTVVGFVTHSLAWFHPNTLVDSMSQ